MVEIVSAGIFGRKEIEGLLPHRGRMLLLDKFLLNAEQAKGELLVTEDLCEGHAVFQGEKIFRGVDVIEMAGQLLGVWALSQSAGPKPKLAILRECSAKFMKAIFPGELLILELETKNIEVKPLERVGGTKIVGRDFLAKVGGELRCRVISVELFAS